MGSRRVSLVDLGRAIGDGWCAFGRGAVRGEALLVPGGGLGIGGEPFPDMNFGYVFGPDGVGEAVRRFHQLLSERRPRSGRRRLAPVHVCALGERAARRARVRRRACLRRGRGHGRRRRPRRRLRDPAGVGPFPVGAHVSRPSQRRCLPHPPRGQGACRSGSTVGIYAVGTRQAHRRRGAAAAAVSAALDHHVRTGAHLFGLLSDPAAEPLYAGLGFAVVDHAQMWRVEGP